MRNQGEKKVKTLRLPIAASDLLEDAARIKKTSESEIAAHAIAEYCRNHGITSTRYTMRATKTCYVVLRQQGDNVDIVDQQVRNGVSLDIIKESYESKFHAPVDLIIDAGA